MQNGWWLVQIANRFVHNANRPVSGLPIISTSRVTRSRRALVPFRHKQKVCSGWPERYRHGKKSRFHVDRALAVIAFIALRAAMLPPVLSRGKAKAEKISCVKPFITKNLPVPAQR